VAINGSLPPHLGYKGGGSSRSHGLHSHRLENTTRTDCFASGKRNVSLSHGLAIVQPSPQLGTANELGCSSGHRKNLRRHITKALYKTMCSDIALESSHGTNIQSNILCTPAFRRNVDKVLSEYNVSLPRRKHSSELLLPWTKSRIKKKSIYVRGINIIPS
jgi:hypothetical protein